MADSPPLPAKGAYSIDFDELDDNFNPFVTKTSVRLSPPLGKSPVKLLQNTHMYRNASESSTGSERDADLFKTPNRIGVTSPEKEGFLNDTFMTKFEKLTFHDETINEKGDTSLVNDADDMPYLAFDEPPYSVVVSPGIDKTNGTFFDNLQIVEDSEPNRQQNIESFVSKITPKKKESSFNRPSSSKKAEKSLNKTFSPKTKEPSFTGDLLLDMDSTIDEKKGLSFNNQFLLDAYAGNETVQGEDLNDELMLNIKEATITNNLNTTFDTQNIDADVLEIVEDQSEHGLNTETLNRSYTINEKSYFEVDDVVSVRKDMIDSEKVSVVAGITDRSPKAHVELTKERINTVVSVASDMGEPDPEGDVTLKNERSSSVVSEGGNVYIDSSELIVYPEDNSLRTTKVTDGGDSNTDIETNEFKNNIISTDAYELGDPLVATEFSGGICDSGLGSVQIGISSFGQPSQEACNLNRDVVLSSPVTVDEMYTDTSISKSPRSQRDRAVRDSGYMDVTDTEKLAYMRDESNNKDDQISSEEAVSDPPPATNDISFQQDMKNLNPQDVLNITERIENNMTQGASDAFNVTGIETSGVQYVNQSNFQQHYDNSDSDDEDFKPACEVFQDQSAWEFFEKSEDFGADISGVKVPQSCRPSVFVRFDPLYARQILDETAEIGREPEKSTMPESTQETPEKPDDDLMQMSTPSKKQPPSNAVKTTTTKPPARKIEPVEKVSSSDVDNLLAMSPAENQKERPAADVSVSSQDIVQILKYSQLDVNRLTKEMELKWNSAMLVKQKEWKKQMAEQQKKYDGLLKMFEESQKDQIKLKATMNDYQKEIVGLVADKQDTANVSNKSYDKLKSERDMLVEDLQTLEASFSDLHRRYEKRGETITTLSKSNDNYTENEEKLQQMVTASEFKRRETIKEAQEKLDLAIIEIDQLTSDLNSEKFQKEVVLKKKNLDMESLQKNYNLKVEECKELSSICESLLKKVSEN